METTKPASKLLSLWNSAISWGTPGAKTTDPSEVIRVKTLTMPTFSHLFQLGQFLGLEGSSLPSQSTTWWSAELSLSVAFLPDSASWTVSTSDAAMATDFSNGCQG